MKITADKLAQLFHEAYEELAPSFNYNTRPDSAKPWASVPSQNKNLMIATAAVVLSRVPRHELDVVAPTSTNIRYEVHDSGGALCLDNSWNGKDVPVGGILSHKGGKEVFTNRADAEAAIERTDKFARDNNMTPNWHKSAHEIVEVKG